MKMEIKLEGIEEVRRLFSKDLMRKTLRSTLDKSATELKREIAKDVAQTYDVKPKEVRDKIRVSRTTQTELETTLNIKSKRPSLVTHFKGRQAAMGAIANVRKGALSFYKGAFVVTPWKKVMKRVGKKRLPIKHMAGPSVTEMVKTETIMKKIGLKWPEIMSKKFKEEVDKRMRGGR